MNLPPKQQKQVLPPVVLTGADGVSATIRHHPQGYKVDCGNYTFLCDDPGEALAKAMHLIELPVTINEA